MKLDRRSVVCALPMGLLAACAKPPPPPPPPRKLPVEVVAAPDINPDLRERASPLNLRVLGLKAQAAFTSADFFSLFDKETATLGGDLLLREEMVLRPGESRRFVWTLPADFRFVGVVAAFRELERSQWRDVHTLTEAPGLRVLLSGRRAFIQAVSV